MVSWLLLAGGAWFLLVLLILCLCRVAARADEDHTGRHFAQGATLAILLAATTVAPPTDAEAAGCRDGDVQFEVAPERAREALACELHRARRKHDAGRLQTHADLGEAARRHASDMRRRGYFGHTSPGGRDLADRVRRAGYARAGCSWRAGEILAWGARRRSTAAALVRAWLDSPPHRAILLAGRYEHVGLGLRAGTPYGEPGVTAAVVLGSRRC